LKDEPVRATFAAVADATRRGILERPGRRASSITELAQMFEMTLTGMKKHVQLLENAGLVSTQKVGRVRMCRLGPRRLAEEAAWIGNIGRCSTPVSTASRNSSSVPRR
jgi:DNA-binding transcriptional ArsR family regulator